MLRGGREVNEDVGMRERGGGSNLITISFSFLSSLVFFPFLFLTWGTNEDCKMMMRLCHHKI